MNTIPIKLLSVVATFALGTELACLVPSNITLFTADDILGPVLLFAWGTMLLALGVGRDAHRRLKLTWALALGTPPLYFLVLQSVPESASELLSNSTLFLLGGVPVLGWCLRQCAEELQRRSQLPPFAP